MIAATWVTIALLTPFWWGLALFIVALIGDMSPAFRPHVSRLFDSLGCTRGEWSTEPASSRGVAA